MSFPFALPGYSYDPIRKKYFSTPTPSSAPTQAPSFSAAASSSSSSSSSSRHPGGPGPSKRPRFDEYGASYKGKEKEVISEGRWEAFSRMQRGGGSSSSSRANRRDLSQASLLASTSSQTSYLPLSVPNSFVTCLASQNGTVIAGDSSGLIYSLQTDEDDPEASRGWMVQMSLVRSPITSINVQNDHFIATSFGPSPKLLYSPLDFSSSPMVIIQPKKATDVWSSLFLPNGAIALGCDSHLLYTPSPLHSPHLSTHQTSSSSVLSLCALPEEPACFLAGTRGGVVRLFDTRTFWRNGRGQEPVGGGGGGGVEAIRTASPVVGMKSVGGGGKNVVVAGMNGDLQIHDLRFLPSPTTTASSSSLPTSFSSSSQHHPNSRKPQPQPKPSLSTSTPITAPTFSLPSHINSYTTGLALLYHASSETVLAAGQDRKVRVWADGSDVALTQHRKKKKRKHGLITSDGESERTGRAGSEDPATRDRSVSISAPPPAPPPAGVVAPIRPKIKLFTSSRRSPSPLHFLPTPSVPSNIDFSLATGTRSLVPTRPPVPAPPIPGPMNQSEVNEDFSNVKAPPNQVIFGTFWQGIEPYVRQIGEEDLAFLKGYKDEDTEPYVLPPLGKPYLGVWEEEDRLLSLGLPLPIISSTANTPSSRPGVNNQTASPNKVLDYPRMSRKEYEFDSRDLKEEDLVVEDKGAGPLTERVVSALLAAREEADAPIGFGRAVKEGGEGMEVDETSGGGGGAGAGGGGGEEEEGWGGPMDPGPERLGMGDMEARMKKELQAVGLLGDEEIDWSQRADDEISTSLRQTQRLLATQVSLNSTRRTTLLSIAQDRLAYAEYLQCLEGLDRIIDSGWHKRQRLLQRQQKRKENTKPGGLGGLTGAREREKEEREKEQNRKIGEALKVAIGRRKKFVEFVGGVFKRAEVEETQGRFWGLPRESVYKSLGEAKEGGEEKEEAGEASGSGTVAEEEADVAGEADAAAEMTAVVVEESKERGDEAMEGIVVE